MYNVKYEVVWCIFCIVVDRIFINLIKVIKMYKKKYKVKRIREVMGN